MCSGGTEEGRNEWLLKSAIIDLRRQNIKMPSKCLFAFSWLLCFNDSTDVWHLRPESGAQTQSRIHTLPIAALILTNDENENIKIIAHTLFIFRFLFLFSVCVCVWSVRRCGKIRISIAIAIACRYYEVLLVPTKGTIVFARQLVV